MSSAFLPLKHSCCRGVASPTCINNESYGGEARTGEAHLLRKHIRVEH